MEWTTGEMDGSLTTRRLLGGRPDQAVMATKKVKIAPLPGEVSLTTDKNPKILRTSCILVLAILLTARRRAHLHMITNDEHKLELEHDH